MHEVFIAGESVDLCVPLEEDFSVWASWFNSQDITGYLDQGKFPNTISMQRDFYNNALSNGRFLAVIKSKKSRLLGVVSLSEINYERSSCQISMVCPTKCEDAPLASLEAMALTIEHAFRRMGVRRVWAGQAYPGLQKWAKRLEILGLRCEGFSRSGFRHGDYVSDAISLGMTYDDFEVLIKQRNNRLWPGSEVVLAIFKGLKQSPALADDMYTAICKHQKDYAALLEKIESAIYSK